jgi:hypothetical protein
MAINRFRMHVGPLGLLKPLPGHPRDTAPDVPLRWPGALHESLSGRTTLDRAGPVRRSWGLSWDFLTEDQETVLQALLRGTAQSPLRLVDPRKRNLFPDDVSTGGSTSQGVTAFTDVGAATPVWTAGGVPTVFTGLLAGRIVWNTVTNTQTLYGTAEQLPVLAGSVYTFSAYVKTTTTFRFSARPFDSALVEGAAVTDAVNNASTAGVWTRLSWAWTPGAGTAAAYLGLTATGSGNIETTGWAVQIDEALKDWTFGYGCPQVFVIPAAAAGYWRTKYHRLQLTLVEM